MPISDVAWKQLEEHRKRLKIRTTSGKSRSRRSSSSHVILTTVGRCIFNDILPQGDAVL